MAKPSTAPEPAELRFRIHGLQTDGGGKLVSADAFSRKVRAFIAALKEADKSVNGGHPHRYLVKHLKMGSAEVGFAETRASTRSAPQHSSVGALLDCVQAIARSDFEKARSYNGLLKSVGTICKGVGTDFSHIEMGRSKVRLNLRVDEFLLSQTARAANIAPQEAEQSRYTGSCREEFGGTIKEVDLRGDVPRLKLVLTGRQREIDCTWPGVDVEELRAALDKKAWVKGFSVYGGGSSTPDRFEIARVEPIDPTAKLTPWAGALEPISPGPWGGDLLV